MNTNVDKNVKANLRLAVFNHVAFIKYAVIPLNFPRNNETHFKV